MSGKGNESGGGNKCIEKMNSLALALDLSLSLRHVCVYTIKILVQNHFFLTLQKVKIVYKILSNLFLLTKKILRFK